MPISSILINFGLFYLLLWSLDKYALGVERFKKLMIFVLTTASIWLLGVSFLYLWNPIFFDHAEVNIANVAASWRWGNFIYTDVSSPERYSLLYGPNTYLVVAISQAFGPSLLAFSKLPGVLSLYISGLLIFLLAKRWGCKSSQGFLLVATAFLLFCGFYNYSYWIRPDSFLILCAVAALALIEAPLKSEWMKLLGLGALAGISMGFKFHGCLYIFPIVVYYLESIKRPLAIGRIFFVGIVALGFLILPFLLPNVGFQNYFAWLKEASKHGLQASEFVKNLTYFSSFFIFLWLLQFHKRFPWTLASLTFCGVLAAIVGSKIGAGSSHLLPLFLFCILVGGREYFLLEGKNRRSFSLVVFALLLSLGLNAVNRQKRVFKLSIEIVQRRDELSDFMQVISKLEASSAMGFSGVQGYLSNSLSPLLVAKSGQLPFDGAALMDMAASGILIPESSLEVLRSCQIKNFIFPKTGEPLWSLHNYYDEKPLFSVSFLNAFSQAYKQTLESKSFIVYSCQK
jgi:hypothetical protein